MACDFVLSKHAQRDLEELDTTIARRIIQKLLWWQKQAGPLVFAISMRHPALGDVRFRVGEYRLIALFNKKKHRVEIIKIGYRKGVYT